MILQLLEARVQGTDIFVTDVNLAAQEQDLIASDASLPRSHPKYSEILNELIDQRLLALDAETTGLTADREAKIRLAAARERILGNIRVEHHLRDVVNETSIRRMYDEQAKLVARGDEVWARHILVNQKLDAEVLLGKIRAGEDFAALAKAHSIDKGSSDRGGDLGYFTEDMLHGEFTTPVFKADKGSYVGPVWSEFGWHIAEVLDRRAASQPSFEAIRPKIVNFMTFDAIEDLLTELRDEAEVVILDDTPLDENTDTLNDE